MGVVMRMPDGGYIITNYNTEVGVTEEWTIYRDGRRFVLTYSPAVEQRDTSAYDIVGFTLYDYEAVFRERGCDGYAQTRVMLERLARETEIREGNAELICTWILSLSLTFRQNMETIVFQNLFELGEELDRLIQLGIEGFYETSDD